jgi:hypothetical protein
MIKICENRFVFCVAVKFVFRIKGYSNDRPLISAGAEIFPIYCLLSNECKGFYLGGVATEA